MTDHEIATAMKTFGGSFYSRLGEAWFHADDDNRARIKAAWPGQWHEYQELARLHAEREAKKAGA